MLSNFVERYCFKNRKTTNKDALLRDAQVLNTLVHVHQQYRREVGGGGGGGWVKQGKFTCMGLRV